MMQHQRGEPREASHEGEPDENALLMMLTNFADITGCDLPVAQEYLQVLSPSEQADCLSCLV